MLSNINSRSVIRYTPMQQRIYSCDRDIILRQIERNILSGQCILFDNQISVAEQIKTFLQNPKMVTGMVIGRTQSGKTGCMTAFLKAYMSDETNIIPVENIYIITGLSDKEWLDQMKERTPDSLRDRVFHRDNLNSSFVNEILGKENILIIMDEIQIAAKENQTLCKRFHEAGLYNKENVLKRDIKIIEFTATPDGTIYDIMKWTENSFKILLKPGPSYTSSNDLFQSGRVKQYKDLCGYDKKKGTVDFERIEPNILEIKHLIERFSENHYHIIRTPTGHLSDMVIENFTKVFGRDIKYYMYDKDSTIQINDILIQRPNKHTFIFIKEKLRCAKTLHKEHLGIMYERWTRSVDDASVIQSIVGRATGNNDNGKVIVFTNIDSIIRYEQLWNSNFEDKTVKWLSKTTKWNQRTQTIESKGTFNNNPEFYDSDIASTSSDESVEIVEETIHSFPDHDEAIKHFKKYIKPHLSRKSNGPRRRQPNSAGFYEATIKKITKVWSYAEIAAHVYRGSANNGSWYYPVYTDTNDVTTLRFCLIHRYPVPDETIEDN